MGDQHLMDLVKRGYEVIPGGINSSIRKYPRDFITAKAEGSHFWDQNGKEYIDYLGAFGPIVVGYNIKSIKDKVKEAVDKYKWGFLNTIIVNLPFGGLKWLVKGFIVSIRGLRGN